MSERGRAVDAAIALGIRIASAGLVFGLQVLLARLMPADGYGGFVTLWTWMLALGSFAALGFAESSIRFLPRYQLRQRHHAIASYWRFGLLAVMIGSLVLSCMAVAMSVVMGAATTTGLLVLLVGLGLPFLGMEYYLEGVARSFGLFRLAQVPVYIVRPVLVAAACLWLQAAGVTLNVAIVGAVMIGAMALVTVAMALMLWRRLASYQLNASRSKRQREWLWLRASLPLLLLSGIDDLTGYADLLLLSLLSEAEDVGIYFAAARTLALAGFVSYAMTLVAGRRFSLDLARGSRSELQRNVLEATRLTFWATIAAVAIAAAVGPLLLSSFGPDFTDGQGILLVLGAGMIARALSGQAGELLIVAGRYREGLMVGATVLALSLLLGLALIPAMGMLGAAVASALAMAFRSVALAWVLRRTEGLRVAAFGLPSLRPAGA